jgi:hypothetical protein
MALVADEPPPELEKTLNVGGLGFQLTNAEKRQFKISPATADRIVKTMKMRGYSEGDWEIAKVTPASSATEYIFTFDPAGVKDKPQIFRLQYKHYELHAVIELADLEASRLPDEAGTSVYDLANKRMRKFVLAVENSRGGYGMRAPAAPAAAGAPPPEPNRYGDLEEMMRNMGVREGGRRRRTKKQKRMRRRATKKKLFT